MNAQKVEQYHISSSHLHTKLLFVCVCERERESKREQKRAKESKRERGVRLIKLFMEENIRERDQRDQKKYDVSFSLRE